ncbi:hypothetical protein I7I48_02212 [Histoplasma ohiense]|nr:hypothetical protein I7I48_02212 [Histoplasma ohiense (nom. inval.)]
MEKRPESDRHLKGIFHTSSLTQILLPRMIWRPYEQAAREFEKSPNAEVLRNGASLISSVSEERRSSRGKIKRTKLPDCSYLSTPLPENTTRRPATWPPRVWPKLVTP